MSYMKYGRIFRNFILAMFLASAVTSGAFAHEDHGNPGVEFRPFKSREFHAGLGAGFPLTHDEEFELRLIASVFLPFPV